MTLYALICNDKPGSLDLRMATREAHLAYARGFADKMRLGGPMLTEAGEMAGSLIFLEVDTLAEAKAFSDSDPYAIAGLFENVQITPFRVTIGKLG